MIEYLYILTTNRPARAAFAHGQFEKFPNAKLIVLDNTKDGIKYWDAVECDHHHIPECENISQMFNWYTENCIYDAHIVYCDDDVEISSDFHRSKDYLKDYKMVFNLDSYMTDEVGNRSTIYERTGFNKIGAFWFAHKDYWKKNKFDPNTIEGAYQFYQGLKGKDDFKIIRGLHINVLIDGLNALQKVEHWNYDMERVYL